MKEVNLEEILKSNGVDCMDGYVGETQYIVPILEAMRQACEKAIDLCIENSKVVLISERLGNVDLTELESKTYILDKQSILNTKNQIR